MWMMGFGQGVNNLWVMGYQSWGGRPFGGTNMDFSTGVLDTSYQSRIMNFSETNGVICDGTGNFLFCSNGIFIQNANNDTMQNGSGLNPCYYTSQHDSFGLTIPQANLIIPIPNDPNKYYLFHMTSDNYTTTYSAMYLYYSLIDMSLDGGLGAVTQKNVVLLNDSLVTGRLTACKHANGRDWWLIAHRDRDIRYYKFLITPYGITGPYWQDIGVVRGVLFGQCFFSPNGKLFAYYEPIGGDLDVFDFDRCSGDFAFKAHVDINDSAHGAGGAFSPNSQVLYLSSGKYVYQFDMTSADIPSTQTTVAIYDGYLSYGLPTSFYLSQLAPDGKIYINSGNSVDVMHVINYPDSIGVACNLIQHGIQLPAFNAFTIANHPNYFLGADTTSVNCDSLTSSTSLLLKKGVLSLFPNPAYTNSSITFTYPSLGSLSEIVLNNIDGKEVARYALPLWSSLQHLKLPKLAKGVYVARLLNENAAVANVKFVVE
jgi:hypothetical protein